MREGAFGQEGGGSLASDTVSSGLAGVAASLEIAAAMDAMALLASPTAFAAILFTVAAEVVAGAFLYQSL